MPHARADVQNGGWVRVPLRLKGVICSARSAPTVLRRAARVRGVPTEVIATPRADQQIAGLDRTHARTFGEFLDDLAARGLPGARLPAERPCARGPSVRQAPARLFKGGRRVRGTAAGLDLAGRPPR